MSLRKTSMTGSLPFSSSSTSSNLIPRMMMGSSSANIENTSSNLEQDQQPYSKEYLDAIAVFREETMSKLYSLLQSERDYTSVPILPTESTDSSIDITQKKSNDQQKQIQQLDDSSVSSSVGKGKKDDNVNMKIKDVTIVNNITKGQGGLDDGTTSLDGGGSSHSKNTVLKKLKPTTATNTGVLKRKKQSDKSDLEQMEDIVKKCQNAYQIIIQEEEKRQALHPTPYFPISGGQSTAVGLTSSIVSAALPDGMSNSSSSGIPIQRQSMASIASSMAPPSISTIRSGRIIPTPVSISSSLTSSKRLLPPIDREKSDSSLQNNSNPVQSISSSSSAAPVANPNKKARKQQLYQSQTANSNSNSNNNNHSIRTSSPVSALRGLQTTAVKGQPPLSSRILSNNTTSTTTSSNDTNISDVNVNTYTTTVGGDSSTPNRIVSDEDPITSITPPPPPDALNFLAKLNKGAAANVSSGSTLAATVSTSTVASTAAATLTSATKPSETEEGSTRMMKTRRQRRG